ncbi:MAG: site-specific integrase [Chloroflexi bacterium]|nr:site-specific integrase [Chloroflexota bacterium]
MHDALTTYLDSLTEAGKTAHTVASTRLDLQQLARYLGRLTLGSVTADDLRGFFAWLGRQQGNSTSSLRRKTATVKGFFRQLHAAGDLEHDPSAELLYPSFVAPELSVLTPAEVEQVVAAAHTASWQALVLCLIDAGLKRDEAVALRCEDVEFVDGVESPGRLHIRHRRQTGRVRQRTLALTVRLAAALREQLADASVAGREAVFGVSARGVDFIVETCGRKASVRPSGKVTPKMLRDAYGCDRIRTFLARERQAAIDGARPSAVRALRQEHDTLLTRELGLAGESVVPDRYRRLVAGFERDRPEQG